MKPIAVILAGGVGKRFKPFVTPKPLFPFFGRPFLAYTLQSIVNLGLDEAIVVSGEPWHDLVPPIETPLTLKFLPQPQPAGMADALLKAENLIAGRPILILNATTILRPDLIDLLKPSLTQSTAFLVAQKTNSYVSGGYLQFDQDRPVAVVEKPEAGHEPSPYVAKVVNFFPHPQEFFQSLKSVTTTEDDQYERGLTQFFKSNVVNVIRYDGDWYSLKQPYDVLQVSRLFLKYHLPPQDIKLPASDFIQGPIYIGSGVKIMPGAIIKGPVYLGDGVVIGDQSVVRQSIIESQTTVGAGSEIVRSYIGQNCKLHRAYIGDSVLEREVNVGAGTVTANWRFDEQPIGDSGLTKLGVLAAKSCRLGVNVSTMPGVKLGEGSLIGPGQVVYQDVSAGTKLIK